MRPGCTWQNLIISRAVLYVTKGRRVIRFGVTRSAVKELQRIATRADRKHILSRVEKLADERWPPGTKNQFGTERYRIRLGHYRIRYTIQDPNLNVYVIGFGDSKDADR